MARAVRFVKAEREAIRLWARGEIGDTQRKDVKQPVCESILRKLDESEAPLGKRSGLSVREAVTAFKEVLDRRVVLPPDGAELIYIQMQRRLTALGLSRQDCVTIAKQAGHEWKGLIKAQSIINQAETLLQNAQQELPWTATATEPPATRDMVDL